MKDRKQIPIDGDDRSTKREVVRHSRKESMKKKRRSRHPIQTFEDDMGAEQPNTIKKRWDSDVERASGETVSRNSGSLEDIDISVMANSASVAQPLRKKSTMLARSRHVDHKMRTFLRELLRFKILKACQIISAIYIAIMSYCSHIRDPETGLIVDRTSAERTERGLLLDHGVERAIIASSTFQVACIFIARLTAWFMYPTLVCVFLTKFRATQFFLSKSQLGIHMNSDSHELHVYCGWTILVCSLIHTNMHIIRWGIQQNLKLLGTHFSGITGVLIITSCLLICVPMSMCRKQIRYEIRKKMHYFFILFALALALHTPRSAMPNGGLTSFVFGTLLLWYFLDSTYCSFFMTEKIETTRFSVLPSGVRMTMTVSEHFQKFGSKGGMCYVCLPWIAKDEWHAFSLFENPANPAERQIFIQKAGDWTSTLHQHTQRGTVRPAWVQGPFPTPYDNATAYDNQILIASGIGITPALSVIGAHKHSRRINLIWAVRNRDLLEFFLDHLYLDHQGWNLIFYTGKEELNMASLNVHANTNVCIISGRPNLHEVIPTIIFGIESGQGLPENYTSSTRREVCQAIVDRLNCHLIERRPSDQDSDASIRDDLMISASELGFQLEPGPISCTVHADEIEDRLTMGFSPRDKIDGAKEYVKQLDPHLVLPTWGMLYCGGAKMVLEDLEKISEEYNIGLHVESFSW